MQAETKRLALEQLHKAKVKSNSQLFLIYMQQALNPNFTIDLLSPWKLIFLISYFAILVNGDKRV